MQVDLSLRYEHYNNDTGKKENINQFQNDHDLNLNLSRFQLYPYQRVSGYPRMAQGLMQEDRLIRYMLSFS